ncbi:UPF0686 protein C11orf1 homolog isoform X1 [Alosa sapidissima]|uniref:UPF0686 protein C11orf1 homolog isoform X1 n=2 Tax=Alosa sapidissima TaxID=34773 RepID=UPI001C09F9EC|nr:UPF0686 protein C11orf1 homolog isoform X1 [Alosa sapidissima]
MGSTWAAHTVKKKSTRSSEQPCEDTIIVLFAGESAGFLCMDSTWTKKAAPFHYMLRANGQSEVWHDSFKDAKLRQFGWRCSTSENAYTTNTLIGNWSEQRFDMRYSTKVRRPLPSQFSDYFETTYSSTYNKDEKKPTQIPHAKEPRSFPGHQPELDPPHTKCVADSSYRQDFRAHGREQEKW